MIKDLLVVFGLIVLALVLGVLGMMVMGGLAE